MKKFFIYKKSYRLSLLDLMLMYRVMEPMLGVSQCLAHFIKMQFIADA